MAKLKTTVHVEGVAYGPGDDVPADVVRLIDNPDVWDGPKPASAGSDVKPFTDPLQAAIRAAQVQASPATPASEPVRSGGGSSAPPRGGPGSGKDAWAAYAASKDVTVDEDATREDIIAALEAADVPTE